MREGKGVRRSGQIEWTGSERLSSRIELVLERGRDSKRWGGQERHWMRER